MLSEKGIKRLTGFLFLFILATSALSGGLAVELNADPDQIANTLRNIAEDPEKYRASITFDLISHMAIIAIASALYLTFNKYNQQLRARSAEVLLQTRRRPHRDKRGS